MSIDIDLGETATGYSSKKDISASIICSELGEAYLVDELNGVEIDVIWLDEIPGKLNELFQAQSYSRGAIEANPVETIKVIKD